MAYTTINKSTDYFNTKLYTGNGSTQAITGVSFQPDWVWIKNRQNSYNHALFDAVRGVTKFIASNNANDEETNANELTAFGADGFTTGNADRTNKNNDSFVSWNWKGGTTSGLSGGSITPSGYSYNATSGFGVYKYTGNGSNSTITHGLGKIPKLVIIKRLNADEDWAVFRYDVNVAYNNAYNYLELNTTNAQAGDSGARWGVYQNFNTNTFGIGTDNATNANGATYVAYVFTDIKGFSKVGTYTGTGNADGPFIYTGFKPAFVMIKATAGSEDWRMYDNKRNGFNPNNFTLYSNLNNAEATDIDLDILSNGFKIRRNSGGFNNSGTTYMYMAFAEAPLVGTNNVPANAR